MSEKTYEIILEVKDIPHPAKVKKLTGEKVYEISKGFPYKIYTENNINFDNSTFKDVYFLIDGHNLNAISENKKMIWITNEENAYWYFRQFDSKYDDDYEDK